MRHLTYLAVLAGCLLGASWLELWPGTRVYRRIGRLTRSVLPTFVAFIGWDLYAISKHHWSYDPAQTVGVLLPGGIPLEEALFFLVVPTCAVLALEAVRRVTGWQTGEEPNPGEPGRAQQGQGEPSPAEPRRGHGEGRSSRDEPSRGQP
jgi:lycopene cyclase domain-containing protein